MNQNREFKFRTWSKIQNRWLNSIVIGENGTPLLCYVEMDDNQKIINKVFTIDNLEPIIQQYTGLKDKNNKEIYEGDIIKATMEKGPHCRYPDIKIHDNQKVRIGEVKWDNYSDGEYVEKIECYIFNDNSLSELIHRTKGNYRQRI